MHISGHFVKWKDDMLFFTEVKIYFLITDNDEIDIILHESLKTDYFTVKFKSVWLVQKEKHNS